MVDKASPMHETQFHAAPVQIGSDRSFGLVFAAMFAIVALWPLRSGGDIRLWAAGAATAFVVLALLLPRTLRPLNIVWSKFGALLHQVVTPVVMGLLFFLTVTPVGVLMRATGKDTLRLKRDAKVDSYWIVRTPPGPTAESMKTQF